MATNPPNPEEPLADTLLQPEPGLRWDDLRLLLAVVEHGSFLAAGRALGLATSTLSRRLESLERSAGRKLLERRHDGVRLTEAGHALAELSAQMQSGLAARLRSLPGGTEELQGTIRVSAGDGFIDTVVATAAGFIAQHPRVNIELASESRVVDIARGDADLALRTGRTRDSALVYERLGAIAYGLYASKDYLRTQGTPRTRSGLASHAFVGFAAPLDRIGPMQALKALGASRFAFRCTHFVATLSAIRAGLGIGALPALYAEGLERVLPRTDLSPMEIFLCSHRDAREVPHLRAFRRALIARLRPLMTSTQGTEARTLRPTATHEKGRAPLESGA